MAVTATTVKKPSENSPLKRANRRRCERKQTPQNRVKATKERNWEKIVEAASLLREQEARGSNPRAPTSHLFSLSGFPFAVGQHHSYDASLTRGFSSFFVFKIARLLRSKPRLARFRWFSQRTLLNQIIMKALTQLNGGHAVLGARIRHGVSAEFEAPSLHNPWCLMPPDNFGRRRKRRNIRP